MSDLTTTRPEASARPGLQTMREVLGDAYADRAMASTDPMMSAFRDAAVTICWDTVWARPGLDRRSRSLITLAMLAALNRPAEIALHAKGALRNGLTADEITEVMVHAAAYCGVPAGLDGLRAARKAIAEADAEGAR